jgi:hypothetical protein
LKAGAFRAATLGLALCGGAADAEPADVAADTAETQIVARAGTARYVSEEPLPDGRVFNREQGSLQLSFVELRHALGDWTVRAALRQSRGTLDYAGQTQFGLPLFTQTDLARREVAIAAEHGWQFDDGPTLSLGGGIESLRTVRDIRSTPISGALTETLRTRQWVLTARAAMTTSLADQPLRWGTRLELTRPWSQSLAVDAHGAVDPLVLRPGQRWGGRLGFDAAWALGAALELGLSLGLEHYRPGASEAQTAFSGGIPVGSASYPGSVQKVRHLGLSLGWRL